MKTIQILIVILSIANITNAQDFVDFTLPSATDNSHFTLSEAKEKYVALHFLLKTECPYCIRHTHEYSENSANLKNVVQVFIKPDTEEEIKKWATRLPEDNKHQFPIYRDINAKLAKQFKIPDGYAFHGQVVHYPALILLDKNGNEVFRYVGKNNGDRYSFEDFSAKIKELKK